MAQPCFGSSCWAPGAGQGPALLLFPAGMVAILEFLSAAVGVTQREPPQTPFEGSPA